jgi:hypothetical protein
VNLPERAIRHLINTNQLEHLTIGKRVHIVEGAWTRYVEANKRGGTLCHGATTDQGSSSSKIEAPGISAGQTQSSPAAAASAQLARQTANRLKNSSANGSSRTGSEQPQAA